MTEKEKIIFGIYGTIITMITCFTFLVCAEALKKNEKYRIAELSSQIIEIDKKEYIYKGQIRTWCKYVTYKFSKYDKCDKYKIHDYIME